MAGYNDCHMWQPARRQWALIWLVAVLVILGWPPDSGRSPGAKLVNWGADPRNTLPSMPAPLPMGLDDDGDAVAAHDLAERSYYDERDRSAITRLRIDLKNTSDPFERSTQRQLLVGLAVVGALLVWQMDGRGR